MESLDADYLEERAQHSSRRRLSTDAHGVPGMDAGFYSERHSLKACKQEDESVGDGAETVFTLYASLLDSALQGTESIFILALQFPKRFISSIFLFSFSVKYGYGMISLKLEITHDMSICFFYLFEFFWSIMVDGARTRHLFFLIVVRVQLGKQLN